MKHALLAAATLLMLVVTTLAAPPEIAPAEAARLVEAGKAVLVDVREAGEWSETGVAGPAVLLPKSDFDGEQKQWKAFLEGVGDRQIILYCRLGRRAGAVGNELEKKGFKVGNAGGFEDWRKAGLPVRKL